MNCLTTDAQRTTFVLIQPRTKRKKKHLVSNNVCAPIFVWLFLYFKSRGQIPRVRCAVVTRLPASEKLVPSTLKGKRELSQKPNLCLWELANFLKEIVALKKCREFLPQKFNGPRLGRYPGRGYSFALTIWVCTSVAPKSTVFQLSNLYCKTVIRFSPSFRKKHSTFPLNFVTRPHSSHRKQ